MKNLWQALMMVRRCDPASFWRRLLYVLLQSLLPLANLYILKLLVDSVTLAVQGSAAMSLLNKNFRNMTSTQMQGLTETIISSTETDILFADYTAIQAVFSYTSENSINPSEYYIPYGVHDGGYFILSDAAKETMLDRMGITEEMLEKMKKN